MIAPALGFSALIAYLLGSIPTGLWLGRALTGQDIRRVGSGSTGATNVLRTFGWRPAAAVFSVDVLKGVVAVWLARLVAVALGVEAGWGPMIDTIAAFAAIAGHNWPVFAGFRGGRGVATGFGTLMLIHPGAALLILLFGGILMVISDTVSLGSVAGAVFAVPCVALLRGPEYLPYIVVSAVIVLIQHRGNIQRLLAGSERRLGLRAKLLGLFLPQTRN